MNLRKYIFITTIVSIIILAVSGVYALHGIQTTSPKSRSVFKGAFNNFAPIKEPVNVLLLVTDKAATNTDTIMVANYNPDTARISLLSIPRDTKVNTRKATKINSIYHNYDIFKLMEQINALFNVNIKYYVCIDISTFRNIIDLLGGVEYTVPGDVKGKGLNYDDDVQDLHIHLKPGKQLLNGAKAEQLLRFRHSYNNRIPDDLKGIYNGGDLSRINIQQDFLKELIRQKAKMRYLPKVNKILETVFGSIKETNFSLTDALRLASNLGKVNADNFYAFKAMGDDVRTRAWYYVYNGKIYNNTTKNEMDGSLVISEYFQSESGFDFGTMPGIKEDIGEGSSGTSSDKSSKSSKGSKGSFTKRNPSNGDSTFKGKIKPDP